MGAREVKRINLPLLVEEVKVEIVKPLPEVLEDRPIHLLPVGAVVEVPRWLASILEEKGFVKVLDEGGMDVAALSKLSWREERSSSLLPAEELLYAKIRALLEQLSREALVNIEAHALKRQAEVKVRDIMRCRLQKLVQAALSPSVPKSLLDSLTPEEKFLFERIKSLINEWLSSIQA